jgi:sulfate adenylyltransferase subunit 1
MGQPRICSQSRGYTNLPLINGRGFGIKVNSKDDYEKFLDEYKVTDRNEDSFSNKWFRFDTYRSVIFHSNYWEI